MNGPTNNLESAVDQMMSGLDTEQGLVQTQGFSNLAQKMAPQEMDKLVDVLALGLRAGLEQIIGKNIQDSREQSKILQTSVAKELKSAEADFGIKDLENKLNVADFVGRLHAELTAR